ncbi:hypothetical protein [Actinokineospora enzanensis]|uniref:hypothetical protein n=1 Tax=Actinokineospora enzanensis TaxID=155975 RepID=UPI0003780161|nr:hypothetical protein [Actinokineospora enzanensis]
MIVRWLGAAATAVLLAGCGTPPALASPPEGLVLRLDEYHGPVAVPGRVELPRYALYGDGTLVAAVPGPVLTARVYHLTPGAVTRLYQRALVAGLGTPRRIDADGVLDASVWVVTVGRMTGPARTTIAAPDPTAGDQGGSAARGADLDPGSLGDRDLTAPPASYEPTRYAVIAAATSAPATRGWPLRPLTPGVEVFDAECEVYAAADIAKLGPLPEAGSVWSTGGQSYRVLVRPMLPDERDCAELNRYLP